VLAHLRNRFYDCVSYTGTVVAAIQTNQRSVLKLAPVLKVSRNAEQSSVASM
jgi:hypothetical protein